MIQLILVSLALVVLWKSVSYALEAIKSAGSALGAENSPAAVFGYGIVLALPLIAASVLSFRAGMPGIMLPALCGFSLCILLLSSGLCAMFSRGTFKKPDSVEWLVMTSVLPLLVSLTSMDKLEGLLPAIMGLAFLQQKQKRSPKAPEAYGVWQSVAVLLVAVLGILIGTNLVVEQSANFVAAGVSRNLVSMLAVGTGFALAVSADGILDSARGKTSLQRQVDAAVIANTLVLGALAFTSPVGFDPFSVAAGFIIFIMSLCFSVFVNGELTKQLGFAMAAIFPIAVLAIEKLSEILGEIL